MGFAFLIELPTHEGSAFTDTRAEGIFSPSILLSERLAANSQSTRDIILSDNQDS